MGRDPGSNWLWGTDSKFSRFTRYLMLCVLLLLGAFSGLAQAQDDFLDPDDAFVFSAAMAMPERLDVHFKVAPEYYMYKDRLEFDLQPETHADLLGQVVLPPGLVKYDPTFDEDLEVYYGQYTLQIPVSEGAQQPLTLTIVSQGCADAGLCYSPTDHVVTLTPVSGGYTAAGDGVVDSVPDIAQSTPPESYPVATGQSPAGNSNSGGLPNSGGFQAGSGVSSLASGGMSTAGASLTDAAAATTGTADSTGRFSDAMRLGDTGFAAYLAQASWFEIVALSMLLGLLLSFTPCVLPMVPILLAILAGDTRTQGNTSRWRGLGLSASFVLGMSLVYTVLGVAAGLVGASMAAWLQTPWVLTVFSILLGVLALAMFDVFTLQAPTGMQSALNERMSKIPGGRYGGVFLMGMVSALIVGPCVAAPLAGVLLFISQTGDVVLGGTSLFAMAWGEGLLLLAVGASSGALLPKAGPWMEGIKRLFGILLLATAWWMVNSVLPAWIMILGWAFLALWSAVMLGAFATSTSSATVGSLLNKTLGLLLALWAVLLVISVAAGGRDLLQPLKPFTASVAQGAGVAVAGGSGGRGSATASAPTFTAVDSIAELDHVLANTDRPVMLDFYADWCVSCIEMEKFTFSDPAVAERMAEFTLVQADVTKNRPQHRELLKRFNLFGPPGIIFFDTTGDVLDDARVVGFQNAEKFKGVLDSVLTGS